MYSPEYEWWLLENDDLDAVRAAEEDAWDRTNDMYWTEAAQIEDGLERMYEEDALADQQRSEHIHAAIAAARAKRQRLEQQLRDRASARMQQWHADQQHLQADLAAASGAARDKIAARVSARQQKLAAANETMQRHFEARVADLQARRDKVTAQMAVAQAGAAARLEKRRQELDADLADAQQNLAAFNSANAAAAADLQRGAGQAKADLATARKEALSEYHTQIQQWNDDLQRLDAQLKDAAGAARDKIAAEIAAVKQKREAAHQKMADRLAGQVHAAQARLDKLKARIAAAHARDMAALQADLDADEADFEEMQRELAAFGQATSAALTDLGQGIKQARAELAAGRARAAGEFK